MKKLLFFSLLHHNDIFLISSKLWKLTPSFNMIYIVWIISQAHHPSVLVVVIMSSHLMLAMLEWGQKRVERMKRNSTKAQRKMSSKVNFSLPLLYILQTQDKNTFCWNKKKWILKRKADTIRHYNENILIFLTDMFSFPSKEHFFLIRRSAKKVFMCLWKATKKRTSSSWMDDIFCWCLSLFYVTCAHKTHNSEVRKINVQKLCFASKL